MNLAEIGPKKATRHVINTSDIKMFFDNKNIFDRFFENFWKTFFWFYGWANYIDNSTNKACYHGKSSRIIAYFSFSPKMAVNKIDSDHVFMRHAVALPFGRVKRFLWAYGFEKASFTPAGTWQLTVDSWLDSTPLVLKKHVIKSFGMASLSGF